MFDICFLMTFFMLEEKKKGKNKTDAAVCKTLFKQPIIKYISIPLTCYKCRHTCFFKLFKLQIKNVFYKAQLCKLPVCLLTLCDLVAYSASSTWNLLFNL